RMDSNIALAGLASGMAGLIGAECCRGVHDTPPGCAWKHCHEKYVWTPVFFTTSPHHGLLQSYPLYTQGTHSLKSDPLPARRREGRRKAGSVKAKPLRGGYASLDRTCLASSPNP